ncbi:Uncharacterised protein [Pseudomonas putida]|nr:hypothetical protein AC138_04865 [Pseudomonas putida]KMY30956.1 hypothetical protein AA993_18950 [Pseudomonas putida]SKC04038.1 hypothetical protein SAMN05216307_2473 [Pseudomonas putida]VEE40816.1 Uncharacterised protein [Pseudomonas putida]VTQ38457.1 Uncharacterised protein [Pseudomonas putida]
MAGPKQNVDRVASGKEIAILESGTHARSHPVTRLKAALFIVYDLVGKQEGRLTTSGSYICTLLLGDDCIKDYPLLNSTKRHPFKMRTSSCKGFFDWQFRPNQSYA